MRDLVGIWRLAWQWSYVWLPVIVLLAIWIYGKTGGRDDNTG